MELGKLANSAALAMVLAAGAVNTALAQSASGFTNVNAAGSGNFGISGSDFDTSGSAGVEASRSAAFGLLGFSASGSSDAAASTAVQVAQQTYVDVIANLEAAGYTVVETKRTLLGRIRIRARNAVHLREVVVSRATGEVKRDEIVEIFQDAGEAGLGAASTLDATGNVITEPGSLGANVGGSVSPGGSGLGSVSGGIDGSVSGALGGLGGSVSGGVSGVSGGLGGSVSGGVSGNVSGSVGGLLGD